MLRQVQPVMFEQQNNEYGRFACWAGLLLLGLATFYYVRAAEDRERVKREKYKRDHIVIVRGTVLQADCSLDPVTGMVHCDELVIMYGNTETGVEETRSFGFDGNITATKSIPTIGSTVLVGWTRGMPESASVLKLE